MPWSPATACPCGGRRIGGRCDRCERGKRANHKQTTTQRGYGHDWRKFRKSQISERPLCEDCLEQGIVTAAQEGHHLTKIKYEPAKRLDADNVRMLCSKCHQKYTSQGL
jgi:5-methylcytosine-specific restriction protein A